MRRDISRIGAEGRGWGDGRIAAALRGAAGSFRGSFCGGGESAEVVEGGDAGEDGVAPDAEVGDGEGPEDDEEPGEEVEGSETQEIGGDGVSVSTVRILAFYMKGGGVVIRHFGSG
jgi:hypothetical protein